MDPTAPNNGSNNPQTPVQPGQFVVAGEDAQTPVSPQQSQPSVSLAGERQPSTPMAAAAGATQPDPTPFAPPGTPGQMTEPTPIQPPASTQGGGGKKTIFILLAVLLLVAIIGAVAYFFVLPMLNKNKTTTTTNEQIVETSPEPVRDETAPGFGEIPESSEPALPADGTTTENPPVDPLANPAQ